jgi:hypothetical protein
MMRFLITLNYVGLYLHPNVFIMSWQMHGRGDNIICRMVGGKNEVGS